MAWNQSLKATSALYTHHAIFPIFCLPGALSLRQLCRMQQLFKCPGVEINYSSLETPYAAKFGTPIRDGSNSGLPRHQLPGGAL